MLEEDPHALGNVDMSTCNEFLHVHNHVEDTKTLFLSLPLSFSLSIHELKILVHTPVKPAMNRDKQHIASKIKRMKDQHENLTEKSVSKALKIKDCYSDNSKKRKERNV